MPNPISGLLQALAFKKSDQPWGTAVACGAGDGVSFISGQAKRDATVQIDESRGQGFSKDGTAGPISADGSSYTTNLRYVGLDVLIACFMGTAGAPTQQAATAAYANTYAFNTDIYGIFGTLAKSMVNYIEEIPSAKVAGITIAGEVGAKPLTITVDIIGIDRETGSTVNTTATFANVTLPTGADGNPVMFSHLAFRMNDNDGDALDAGDTIYPSKFSLSLKRKLKGDYTGEFRTDAASPQDLIDEPSNDGLPELTLTLEFPVHSAATYMDALGADTRKKLDITATGGVIEGAYNFEHKWEFPHLQLKNVNPTDDTGRIKEPLEFIIHGASAAPAGMAVTDPLAWSVRNTNTVDPLA